MGNKNQPTFKRLTVPVAGQTGAEKRQRPSDVKAKNKAQVCASLEQSGNCHPFKLPRGLVGTKKYSLREHKGRRS